MIRKYEEHVVYTEEFLSHLDTHYKVIKLGDKIVEFLKSADSNLFYSTNSPPDYEYMITINRFSYPTSEFDVIFYILFTITNNTDIKIDFHWGKSVKTYHKDKWNTALLFLRHLMSSKEDYGEYYSFSTVIKQNDINKIISDVNVEHFNFYKDTLKFNL